MRSPTRATRLALALVGVVAAVAAPVSVSAPAWAAPSPVKAPTEVAQSQWGQHLDKIAASSSVLGVADNGSVVRLPAGASASEQARIKAELPASARTAVTTSRFTKATLDRIQQTAMKRDWNKDADKYGLVTSYDAQSDKVALYTDAPASVTQSLRTAYPGDLDVHPARVEAQFYRFGDVAPFWGGGALTGSGGKCTAGFTVQDRATDHLYMLTAGHCYNNLVHVYSRNFDDSAGNEVGQVTRRDTTMDTEALYKSAVSYGTDLFVGGTSTSQTHIWVQGVEDGAIGTKVCVSGATSFNHCGHPISNLTTNICYGGTNSCIEKEKGFTFEQGGTNWPNYDNGQLTQPGDSGAPIYTTDHTDSAAWIVGLNSGAYWTADDPCRCSVQHMVGVKIDSIEKGLNVEVVARG